MAPEIIARINSLLLERPKYDFLSALMRRAINRPADRVITDGQNGLSAEAMLSGILRYASHFSDLGILPQQIVGVQCDDRLLQIMIHGGLLALGAIRLPLNTLEASGAAVLDRCDYLICQRSRPEFFDANRFIQLNDELNHKLGLIRITEQTFDCFVRTFSADDPLMIGNTSSTTGDKKYFYFTRGMMALRTQFICDRNFKGKSRNFIALYEDGHGSTHVGSTCALLSGGEIVFCTLANWFMIARSFPESSAIILPRDVSQLIKNYPAESAEDAHKKIKLLRVLGGALSEVARSWLRTHVADHVINSYSSNEAGQVAEVDSTGTGTLYPGVQALVTDEHMTPLPFGTPGLIWLKTVAPITRYLWNDLLNKRAFKDDWYCSNDLGILIDDQTLQLLGRADDMLNLGGTKVSPAQFESVFKQISDINDCAVMARNLNSGGARFLVCVETNTSQHSQDGEILTKQIYDAAPEGFGDFDLVFFEEFPVTETRKVRRTVLMELALKRLETETRAEAISRAKALLQSGRLAAAEAIYIELLKSESNDFYCLHLLGLIQIQKGQADKGVRLIAAAINLKPDSALAYYNLGNGLYQLARFGDALACYQMSLSIQPAWPEALSNCGNALLELDRAIDALACFDRALLFKPDYAEAYYNRGNALLELQQFEAALSSFDAALAFDPNDAESLSNRGNALHKLHRLEDALQSYQLALALRSDYADVFNNIGHVFKDLNDLDASIQSYESALKINPDYEYLFGTYVHTKLRACHWSHWQSDVDVFESHVLSGKKVTTPSSVLSLTGNPAVQKAAAEIYSTTRHPPKPLPHAQGLPPQRKTLRIGYVSSDFREHAVSYLMAGVFEAHDRERFEVYGYDIGPAADSPTRRRVIAAFDHFKIVSDLSDRAVAEQIRQDQIDILIDLTGYTKGARTGIFAYRPAPIQINYLGFPGTMGAPFMDYIIADRVLIPEEPRQYYTEKVLYLPHCFQANDDKRVIAPSQPKSHFGLPEDALVFGCFNQSAKFTPTLFDVWLSILRHVPNSVIWLIQDNPTQVQNLRTYTQERGIDPNRLIFTGKLPYPEHLARYAHIDLVLDTLPFNGGTTTSDALWGGAPVLTCIGQTFAGRMSASLLTAIGLPELITNTLKDYERLAIDLATHPEQLKALRQRLAKNRTECPVFDTQKFTQELENTLFVLDK